MCLMGTSPLIRVTQLGRHAVTNYGHKHIKAWHTNMPLYVSRT